MEALAIPAIAAILAISLACGVLAYHLARKAKKPPQTEAERLFRQIQSITPEERAKP